MTGTSDFEARPPAHDAQLMSRVVRGDREAATLLILRHQQVVRSFLYRLTGDAHVADDLTQETLLRMLQHAAAYDGHYPLRTWLLTIARRLTINRAQLVENRRPARTLPELPSAAAGPADQLAQQEEQLQQQSALEQALVQLTEPQRAALLLFHQQQLSLHEVARTMDLPVNTVKSHLHRARTVLRRLLLSPSQGVDAP